MRALLVVMLAGCAPVVVVGSEQSSSLTTNVSRSCEKATPYERTVNADNHCLRWPERTITWHLDVTGSAQIPGDEEALAIERAFSNWRNSFATCSDLAFVQGHRLRGRAGPVHNDNLNAVIFRESACADVVAPDAPCWADLACANVFGCWDHLPTTVGLTTSTFRTDGVLLDVDIELNAAHFFFTVVDQPMCTGQPSASCVSTDLEGTVTHEIGHLLGLDHASGATFSTMEPTAKLSQLSQRHIDASSACFVCDAYPSGLPSRDCQR